MSLVRTTALVALSSLCTALDCAAPLLAAPPPGAQDVAEALAARARRAAAEVGGVEALVLLGADPLWHGAFAADPARTRPVGEAFRAPDLLRPALTLAVLRLVGREAPEGGAVGLDRPLGAYVAAAKPLGDGVTLRRLLAGTSGVAPYEASLDREQRATATVDALVAHVASEGLVTTPGTCFDPNESEVLLLGALVEAVTGAKVDAALSALFSAAGLEATAFRAEGDAPEPREAAARRGDELPRPVAPFGEDRLCTTVPDLARLARAVAARVVLDEEGVGALLAPERLTSGASTGAGLGVELVRLGELGGVSLGGARERAWRVARYPDADLTLVVLAGEPDADLGELTRGLARAALGLAPPGVQDLALEPSVAQRFVGEYLMGCDRVTVAQGSGGRLVLQVADRTERVLLFQGGTRFVARGDEEVQVDFRWRAGEERASGLVVREHGLWNEAVRVQ